MSVKIGNIDVGEFPLLLAPMEDVSDPPFRALCKENGADVMYTEFISSEGLIRDAVKSTQKLDIYDFERPIGIQIFGSDISSMKQATEICAKEKPEIIDINYGCPVKKVANKGAGAGILQNIPKMISMTKEIVNSTDLPVTVKTRLGWDENSKYIVEVAERLQDVGIQAISIHGRTRKQMYKGEADWTLIGEVKNKYGVDGVMIGRGAIGYPWIFNEIKHYLKTNELLAKPNINQRVDICKRHLKHSVIWKGERTGIAEMKRHYSSYFKAIPNFKEYRTQMVISNSEQEVLEILDNVTKNFSNY